MLSSAGNEGRTILPQAKKPCWNAVARAAAFRRSREQGSKTPECLPGWRSQREDQIMLSRAAAFRRSREQGSKTPECLPGWRSQREDQIMLSRAAAFRRSREQGSKTQK